MQIIYEAKKKKNFHRKYKRKIFARKKINEKNNVV